MNNTWKSRNEGKIGWVNVFSLLCIFGNSETQMKPNDLPFWVVEDWIAWI